EIQAKSHRPPFQKVRHQRRQGRIAVLMRIYSPSEGGDVKGSGTVVRQNDRAEGMTDHCSSGCGTKSNLRFVRSHFRTEKPSHSMQAQTAMVLPSPLCNAPNWRSVRVVSRNLIFGLPAVGCSRIRMNLPFWPEHS